MKVLVYVETKEGTPVQGSLELLTGAKELGETYAVAVEDKDAAEKAAALGAKVIVLKTGDASEDAQTAALESYIKEVQPELVLFSGTQLGKDLAPRLAHPSYEAASRWPGRKSPLATHRKYHTLLPALLLRLHRNHGHPLKAPCHPQK